MGEVPDRQILDHVRAHRAPAWVLVADDDAVVDLGGDLERYGLDELRRGDLLTDHAPVFDGLEPSRDEPLLLPSVSFAGGTFADVHAARVAEGRSFLLLDCTENAGLLTALQQKANELELASFAHDVVRTPTLADVVADLGVAVFQVDRAGVLDPVGRRPEWCAVLGERFPLDDDGALDVDADDFAPFLAHFIAEARDFWDRAVPGRLRSGLWTERLDDGDELPLEATALLSTGGHRALLVQPMHDTFHRRRRTLQQARDTSLRLEHLNRDVQMREVLLHCIVHDLKGPLSVILGGLELLRRPTLADDKRSELVEMGIEQGERQLDMIRLILDVFSAEIASMQAFETDPARAPDPSAIVAEVVAADASQFEARGVELVSRVEIDPAVRVVGQVDRLRRVLMNLLENALRHAPRGSTVSVGVTDDGDGVVLAVEDEGPGVDASLRDTLFEKFRRDPRAGGMAGLGLYFCRDTVEQWGGTIGYSPRAPRGSRFWFRLPKAAADETARATDDASGA